MRFYILFTTLFIALDIVTGLIFAISQHVYKSSNMRVGLYHKAGLLLTMVFAIICEYAQRYIDLGLNVPFVQVISMYIIFMEITSICENLHKINPEISVDSIKKLFNRR